MEGTERAEKASVTVAKRGNTDSGIFQRCY